MTDSVPPDMAVNGVLLHYRKMCQITLSNKWQWQWKRLYERNVNSTAFLGMQNLIRMKCTMSHPIGIDRPFSKHQQQQQQRQQTSVQSHRLSISTSTCVHYVCKFLIFAKTMMVQHSILHMPPPLMTATHTTHTRRSVCENLHCKCHMHIALHMLICKMNPANKHRTHMMKMQLLHTTNVRYACLSISSEQKVQVRSNIACFMFVQCASNNFCHQDKKLLTESDTNKYIYVNYDDRGVQFYKIKSIQHSSHLRTRTKCSDNMKLNQNEKRACCNAVCVLCATYAKIGNNDQNRFGKADVNTTQDNNVAGRCNNEQAQHIAQCTILCDVCCGASFSILQNCHRRTES